MLKHKITNEAAFQVIDRSFAARRLCGKLSFFASAALGAVRVSRRGAKTQRAVTTRSTVTLIMLLLTISVVAQKPEKGVRVVANEASRRVDVFIDGQPFTAYIWPESLMKPVLYPLHAADGTLITRGFPLDPRPGERVDHPHQVGLWFSYGDVNGIDFWNNSTARTAEEKKHMGTTLQRRIVSTKNGKERGELEVETDWLGPDGKTILREHTRFVFHAAASLRGVDRITTLTALDQRVVFKDSKEGLFGLRVRRELEQPSTESLVFTDDQGRPTAVPKMDNTGVTGLYSSSEGKTGDDVWGTRGRWAILTGSVAGKPITLAILDHAGNAGAPSCSWGLQALGRARW